MTKDEIAESRRICKAATKGPWIHTGHSWVESEPLYDAEEANGRVAYPPESEHPTGSMRNDEGGWTWGKKELEWFAQHKRAYESESCLFSVNCEYGDTPSGRAGNDCDFITHARTALPAALDEIDALEAMFERSGRAAEERELELAEAWAERDRYKAALWEILELRPECDQATIANKALGDSRDEQGGK